MYHSKLVISVICVLAICACSDDYIPKPRGFQRIDLPAHTYKTVENACGYTCEIPDYAEMLPDTHPSAEPCWFNIYYAPFNATLHLSYKELSSKNALYNMMEDSRMLVYKHTVKADEILETQLRNKFVTGMLYELSGSTATNFQFYVTDTVTNFLRGSLYFNTQTNNDSVAPALDHLKMDVLHMIETLRWKKSNFRVY